MCKIRTALEKLAPSDEFNGHTVYTLPCFDHQPVKGDEETFEVDLHVMPRCDDFEIIIRPFGAIEGDRNIFYVDPVGAARLLRDLTDHLEKTLHIKSAKVVWGHDVIQEDDRYVFVLRAQ